LHENEIMPYKINPRINNNKYIEMPSMYRKIGEEMNYKLVI